MAQLDRFLAAMSEYKAEALVLEQDRAPVGELRQQAAERAAALVLERAGR